MKKHITYIIILSLLHSFNFAQPPYLQNPFAKLSVSQRALLSKYSQTSNRETPFSVSYVGLVMDGAYPGPINASKARSTDFTTQEKIELLSKASQIIDYKNDQAAKISFQNPKLQEIYNAVLRNYQLTLAPKDLDQQGFSQQEIQELANPPLKNLVNQNNESVAMQYLENAIGLVAIKLFAKNAPIFYQ